LSCLCSILCPGDGPVYIYHVPCTVCCNWRWTAASAAITVG
jgi:hypothetical protein